jgi:acyl dehydratase
MLTQAKCIILLKKTHWPMNTKAQQLPSILKSYAKLLFTKRTGVPKDGDFPEINLQVELPQIPEAHLQKYVSICQFKQKSIPITYPYALAGPLHLALLAHPDFPIKSAGLLHLRNKIQLQKQLPQNTPIKLTVKTAGCRFRPQGFEFDAVTTLEIENEEVWVCTSTFLKRGKFEKEDPATPEEDSFIKLPIEQENATNFLVPSGIGRKYAAICKDYNPIHISSLLAKLFGFKRSIAHGMWVSAAALAKLDIPEIREYNLAFKGPVFTGSEVFIKLDTNTDSFNLFEGKNPRPVILSTFS